VTEPTWPNVSEMRLAVSTPVDAAAGLMVCTVSATIGVVVDIVDESRRPPLRPSRRPLPELELEPSRRPPPLPVALEARSE
jgi:hypothetical protein